MFCVLFAVSGAANNLVYFIFPHLAIDVIFTVYKHFFSFKGNVCANHSLTVFQYQQQEVIFIYVLFSIFCKYLKSFNGLLYKGVLDLGLYFVLQVKKLN